MHMHASYYQEKEHTIISAIRKNTWHDHMHSSALHRLEAQYFWAVITLKLTSFCEDLGF